MLTMAAQIVAAAHRDL